MWYSCITTLAIWVYIEKGVVIPDNSNPNKSISKIFDVKRPDDEWAEITFWGRQNDENEHCVTLKKLIYKLNFHHQTCLYMISNVVFVYYYSSNLNLKLERGDLCKYF